MKVILSSQYSNFLPALEFYILQPLVGAAGTGILFNATVKNHLQKIAFDCDKFGLFSVGDSDQGEKKLRRRNKRPGVDGKIRKVVNDRDKKLRLCQSQYVGCRSSSAAVAATVRQFIRPAFIKTHNSSSGVFETIAGAREGTSETLILCIILY